MKYILVFVALLMVATTATFGSSVTQRWQENPPFSVDNTFTVFDTIRMTALTPGDTFDSPGVANFSVGGWSGSLLDPNHTVMTGPDTSLIQWDQYFTSSDTNGQYLFTAWLDGKLVDAAQVNWNGTSVVPLSASSVPEPATYGMLGTGLIGLGMLVRRRQQKNE